MTARLAYPHRMSRRASSRIIAAALFLAVGGAAAELVQVGSVVPDVVLESIDGVQHQLSQAVTDGPVVLVLYRGVW